MNQKLKYLFTSRKFWATLIGLLLIIAKSFRPDFPLTEDQLVPIVALLVTFILGTAVEDAGRAIGQGQTPNQLPAPPPSEPYPLGNKPVERS